MIWLGVSPAPSSSVPMLARRHRPLPLHTIVLQASSTNLIAAEQIIDQVCAHPTPIIRQGSTWTHRNGEEYKVLMTAPVIQGVVDREKTKLIVIPASDKSETSPHINGHKIHTHTPSESGTKATRLTTLDDFDATAFLTASLEINLHQRFSGENDLPPMIASEEIGSLSASINVSSGSLTPTPARSSPVADGERWVAEHAVNGVAIKGDEENESMIDDEGIRFDAVALQVPPESWSRRREIKKVDKVNLDVDDFLPDEEAMCWLSVSDLARSGIFADDWVGWISHSRCVMRLADEVA